jgi:redox-sensitive bicupin YhaK (pirin superfamily)
MSIEILPGRRTELGSIKILRALPQRQGRKSRVVGPWCFLDRYGPLQINAETAMDVAPHPHMGLQTVSWLVAGELVHKDSLGCEALMRAGQLNLMTSGRGIAHSEETPTQNSGKLDGVQLWVALPEAQRKIEPSFEHHASLPVFNIGSATIQLIIGKMLQQQSPAKAFSPIIGAEIDFPEKAVINLPLDRSFEHAIMVLHGEGELDGTPMETTALHYMRPGNDEVRIHAAANCRLLLIGGEPFRDRSVIWWNFVARTHEEIAEARQSWIQHERFGEVVSYKGPRVPAPYWNGTLRRSDTAFGD